jgi:exonuclease SbcC
MRIELKSMTLNNFKGIKSFSIDFKEVTNIFGENGIGKTTFFDAFRWLFFGKDSFDRKDFNIKNTVNLVLNRQDHEVCAVAMIDDVHTTFRRVMREKWVKKHGEKEANFTGHETLFFINDVPFQQGEYAKKIDEILNESIFKLITDPQYFNRLKWQDRRSILLDMAGMIEPSDILTKITTASNKVEIAGLSTVLNSGKTVDEYKREITSKKKIINDNLKAIPFRIDELYRSLPEAIDFDQITNSINEVSSQISNIDNSINDRNLAYEEEYKKIQAIQSEIHTLTSKRNGISYQAKIKIQNSGQSSRFQRQQLLDVIEDKTNDLKSKNALINSKKLAINGLDVRVTSLRDQWTKLNESELIFDQHEFTCPTCLRAFEADDIEEKKAEMQLNFDNNKTTQLGNIQSQGKQLSNEIAENKDFTIQLETAVGQLNNELVDAQSNLTRFDEQNNEPIQSLEDILSGNDDYVCIGATIASLEAKIKVVPTIDISDLKSQKQELTCQVDYLKRQLGLKDQIAKTDTRIEELKSEENTLAQQLADLEQIEFTINEFDRAKIDTMEERINHKFKYVKFKMFDRQINGGESETCETLVDGVPYSDANNAGRINSGLDIINALCEHYNAYAPIFIDNKESIIQTIPVRSQVINLIVSEGDKQLRVA